MSTTRATTGTTRRAADYLLQRLRELRKQFSPVCLISGGEVTVKVTNGGVGGRNQQFALACAEKIAGENITVLSAGTDGVDGNSPAAGAVVDGTTVGRERAVAGLDVRAALEKFDAYPLFSALGDVIETGPTGNNLRDLRICWRTRSGLGVASSGSYAASPFTCTPAHFSSRVSVAA